MADYNNVRERNRLIEDLKIKRDETLAAALQKADTPEKIKKANAIHTAQENVDSRFVKVEQKKADVEAAEVTQKEFPGTDNAARVATKKQELEAEEELLKLDKETLALVKKGD